MSKRTGGAPHARYLSRKAVAREAPGLDPDVVIAGLQYPDGRMDDARHTLAVARTAASYGAQVITHARVTGVRTAPDGRAAGVTADDVRGRRDVRRLGAGRRERGRRVGGRDPAARRRAHVHHRPGQGRAPARPQGGVRLDDGHPVEGRGLGDHPAQVVRPLAAGHHRHPLQRRQEQPRLPRRRTSTTCCATSTSCCAARSSGPTCSAPTPGCARCSPPRGRTRSRPRPCPATTP